MKNLWKAADRAEISEKFIWQNNDTPSNASNYENNIEYVHADTKERLQYLKDKNKISANEEKKWIKDINVVADEAMKNLIPLLNNPSANKDKIVSYTVNRTLGGRTLEKARNRNNMYRTEIVSRINEYLKIANISPDDSSLALIKAMGKMSFPDGTPTYKKLVVASNAMKYGSINIKPSSLKKLANKMDKEGEEVFFDENGTFEFNDKEYEVKNFEVLTGAAMTGIDKNFLSEFVVEKVVMEDGKLVGVMKNGCKGNFVIMDVREKKEVKTKECWDGSVIPIDQKCPPKPTPGPVKDDCIDCDKIKTLTTYETFLNGDLNNCFEECEDWDKKTDAEKIEINMKFLDKNGVFNKLAAEGLLPEDWDDLNYQGKYKKLSLNKRALVMALGQEMVNVDKTTNLANFLHDVFKKGGIKADLLDLIDGRLFEGGAMGWILQLPKLFMSKNAKTRRAKKQISRKLGWKLENFDSNWGNLMIQFENEMVTFRKGMDKQVDEMAKVIYDCDCKEEVAGEIANQLETKGYDHRAVAAFRSVEKNGIGLSQALKLLPTDILVSVLTFVGQVVAAVAVGGVAVLTGPALLIMGALSIVLTDIKLPYFLGGSNLVDMPSLDAIASTKWGNSIGNSYSGAMKQNFAGLESGLQYSDAAMQRSVTEDKQDYEKGMLLLSDSMESTVSALLAALAGKDKKQVGLVGASTEETYDIAKKSFGFLENTDGRRRDVRKERRNLNKSLKTYQKSAKTESDRRIFLSEISEPLKTIQNKLITEVNDDFGTNFEFEDFNKEIKNDEEFTISLSNGKIKATIEKFTDDNGRIGLRVKNEDWGKALYKGRPIEGLRKGKRRRIKNRVKRKIDKMTTQLNGVKSLNGLATSADFYVGQAQERNLRIDAINEGNAEYMGILNRLRTDSDALQTLLNFNEGCTDCPAFSPYVEGLIKDFIAEQDVDKRDQIFDELMKVRFDIEYNRILESMENFNLFEENGKIYFTIDGGDTYKECTPENLPKLEKNYHVYTQLVGRTHNRFSITPAMFKPAIEKVTGKSILSLGKNTKILAVNDRLGYDAALKWIQTKSQWAGQGVTDYVIQTTADGAAVTGIQLIMPGATRHVITFSGKILAENLTIAVLANLLAGKNKNQPYYNPNNDSRGVALKDTVKFNGKRYVKDEKGNMILVKNYQNKKKTLVNNTKKTTTNTKTTSKNAATNTNTYTKYSPTIINNEDAFKEKDEPLKEKILRGFLDKYLHTNTEIFDAKYFVDLINKNKEMFKPGVADVVIDKVNSLGTTSIKLGKIVHNGTKIKSIVINGFCCKLVNQEDPDDIIENNKAEDDKTEPSTTNTTKNKTEVVNKAPITMGGYINLPYNTKSVQKGDDGELTLTLEDGTIVKGTYEFTENLKKPFFPDKK